MAAISQAVGSKNNLQSLPQSNSPLDFELQLASAEQVEKKLERMKSVLYSACLSTLMYFSVIKFNLGYWMQFVSGRESEWHVQSTH